MTSNPSAGKENTGDWKRDGRVALAGAVILYALIPTAIGYIGGKEIPFLFQAAWRVGMGIGILFFLILLYLKSNSNGKQKPIASPDVNGENAPGRAGLAIWVVAIIVGGCDYALFAFSLNYIGIAFATALFGLWPIFNVGLRKLREKVRKTKRQAWPSL